MPPENAAASTLTLDHLGIHIQGPPIGIVPMLIEAGAKVRRAPRSFPIREWMQLICVIDHQPREVAMWVQDRHDLGRCRDAHNATPELVTWLEIGNDPLFYAKRLPAPERVLPSTNGHITTTKAHQ